MYHANAISKSFDVYDDNDWDDQLLPKVKSCGSCNGHPLDRNRSQL